jgi:hypothetical protein
MKYLLLLVVALFLGMPGAMAFTAVTGTLDTSYGDIDYSITGDGAQTQAATVDQSQSASNAHIFVEGFSAAGTTSDDFNAWIEANTDAGDYAYSSLDADGATLVDNLNLYGFITPNLAWTGIYVDEVKATDMELYGDTYNKAEDEPYQETDMTWDTDSVDTADYYAKQVWMTNQAGGSADPGEFPVGQTNGFNGEGTYAMGTMEYGTFGISGPNQADGSWNMYGEAYAYSPDTSSYYLLAELEDQYFEEGKLEVAINTPAMNYADADVAYSNTDFHKVIGSGLTYMDADLYADSYDYPPDTSRDYEDDKEVDYIPLSTIDNVFSYALARATPTRTVVADIVFY